MSRRRTYKNRRPFAHGSNLRRTFRRVWGRPRPKLRRIRRKIRNSF